VQNGERRKLQFIKNFNGSLTCKPFRKYNVVEGWYNKSKRRWVYCTKYGIHFIPCEFVKVYKH
jgi:hypothetical protein